jgi:hypothetical protein
MALLAVVVISIPVYFAIQKVNQQAQTSSNGTQPSIASNQASPSSSVASATPNVAATVQSATATAVVDEQNATVTAVAEQTVTTQEHATATAGALQTVIASSVAYSDSLKDANNPDTINAQWDQNSRCSFLSDGYHVTIDTGLLGVGKLKGCLERGKAYANLAVSVDMNIVGGHTGGIFFRVDTPLTNVGAYSGYLFEVGSDGYYKISLSQNFTTGTGNKTLQEGTLTSGFKAGTINTLQVMARGSNLTFAVNGVVIQPATGASFQDTTFTSGDIALLATSSTGGSNADVVYSNLKVSVL